MHSVYKILAGIVLFFLVVAGCAGTAPADTPLVYRVQKPTVKTEEPSLMILLHGLGSNEHDLFGLAPYLPRDMVVISARAPVRIGENAYAWFKVERNGRELKYDKEEAEKARLILVRFIDEMTQKFNIHPGKVFLLGFSQGAIMSYSVALTAPEKLKGIVALSGRLLPEIRGKTVAADKLKNLHAFIGHGTLDDVLPVSDSRSAYDFCKASGMQVVMHEYVTDHRITDTEFDEVLAWLKPLK